FLLRDGLRGQKRYVTVTPYMRGWPDTLMVRDQALPFLITNGGKMLLNHHHPAIDHFVATLTGHRLTASRRCAYRLTRPTRRHRHDVVPFRSVPFRSALLCSALLLTTSPAHAEPPWRIVEPEQQLIVLYDQDAADLPARAEDIVGTQNGGETTALTAHARQRLADPDNARFLIDHRIDTELRRRWSIDDVEERLQRYVV